MILQLLGGRTPSAFLSQYWQKHPLLVRNAVPGFSGLVGLRELRGLAAREEVESRLVMRAGRRWTLEHGPLAPRRLARLPEAGWTLLVQGLNLHLEAADRLLRGFNFVPHARLDDLMVSYAAPGGGVGPHVDSYDVFLLQGPGRRRWRIAGGPARAARGAAPEPLLAAAPLSILRQFKAEREYILDAGDMLYLPPGWAHEGVALTPCTTYSIGFRAPARRELQAELLARWAEHISGLQPPEGARGRRGGASERYADPGLRPARHPSAIPRAMLAEAAAWLSSARPTRRDIAALLGGWLSEPKARVVFDRPDAPLPFGRFRAQARARGVRLDLRTLMLSSPAGLHINGETCATGSAASPAGSPAALLRLADRRALSPAHYGEALCRTLHGWYLHGWLHIGESP